MKKRTRGAISAIVLALGLLPASHAGINQDDVARAANAAAFIETCRVMIEAGALPADSLAASENNYRPTLEGLYAQYENKGEGAAFRRAVEKAAAPQLAAVRSIYPSNPQSGARQRPSGFPAALPLPSDVIAPLRGSDAVDTAARQVGALNLVHGMIETWSPRLDILTQPPDVAAWLRAYKATELAVMAGQERRFAADPCRGEGCDRHRFVTAGYENDPEFRNEVLLRHFPAGIADAYLQKKAQDRAAFQERWGGARPRSFSGRGIFIGLGAVLVIIAVIAALRARKPASAVSDNYGRASFAAPARDIPHPSAFLQGVFLGKGALAGATEAPPLQMPFAPVFSTAENHVLVVARQRTGKGTRVIVPTLLRYYGSMLVVDPKGENAAITARSRKTWLNQAVHIVNPWNELGAHFAGLELGPSATYNPLDVLDRHDPNAVAIAQAFAAAVCPVAPGAQDSYWSGSAANVFAAVLLWITEDAEEQKTLGRAREIVTRSRTEFQDNYLSKMKVSPAFGGAISEMISQYIDLAPETYSSIMSNLAESTKFLSDPQIKASTAASSFKMEDLIFGRTTIYLVIPPERMDTQRTWLRLVLTAATHTFKKHRFAKGRKGRCMFLIDEFAALGRMDDVPRDIATLSGYGLDMTLIVQGVDQLRATYGESADTILNNCAYKWFCNIGDLTSAKYVSESLGNKTVRTTSTSQSKNEGKGGGSEGESTSYGETGRPLMRPEEILTLGRDFAIAFPLAGQPYYLQPVDYWNLTEAFSHLEAAHPTMYAAQTMRFDPNPYAQQASAAAS